MGRFEERLWSIVRNFIVLGRTNPALLVSAVRVVEMQETVDKQISASGQCAHPKMPDVLSCAKLLKEYNLSYNAYVFVQCCVAYKIYYSHE